MSLVVLYHDSRKAVVVSDDRMCREDPATLVKTRIDGRICKIVVLPKKMVLGTVGRVDLTEKLFRGISRMVEAEDFRFEELSAALPEILRMTWAHRTPMNLSDEVNKQDGLLVGVDCKGKIRCHVFRSEDDFKPIETTTPGNRVVVLGGFELVDEKRLHDFTMDVGLRGEKLGATWIALKIRDLVNEISGLHPEVIGLASYFAALKLDGPIGLPEEFPPPPILDGSESTHPAGHALAEAGRMFVGSILTPAAGAPDTVGNNDGGGGAQIGNTVTLDFSTLTSAGISGNAVLTNPNNAIDGDPTTFAKLTLTGNGAHNAVGNWKLGGPPGISSSYSSATLNVRFAVPTNSLTPLGAGQGVANITYDNIAGTVNGVIVAAPAGTTVALQTVSVALPLGLNLSQFVFTIGVNSFNGTADCTAGSLELDVYEVFIEAIL